MKRILPGIDTLEQHLAQLESNPEAYRPARCPSCGKGGLRCHGHYLRKADREGKDGSYLDPVPIPRYSCSKCGKTCSKLPGCLPPRRWYLWARQQAVLEHLLAGRSLRRAARAHGLARRTISRWWHRLKERFLEDSLHLRSRFAELGRHAGLNDFWSTCIRWLSLAGAMAALDQQEVVVP